MYNILRIIIIIIILTIYFILIRKKINKITIAIGIFIGIILLFVLSLNPIERNFIGFNSVEDVVKYQYPTKLKEDEPAYIKEEGSALVMFKYETYPYLIEKENEKWRMCNSKIENMEEITIPSLSYNIIKVNSSKDNKAYILLESALDEKEIKEQQISDSNNSKFDMVVCYKLHKSTYSVTFATVIDSNIENYKLYINGRTIKF